MVLIIEYDTFTDNFLCRLLLPVFLEKKHWSLECLPKYAFLIFFLQEWKVCKESYCWIEIIFSIEDCIVLLSISIAHTKRVKSIIRIALHEKYPYSELFWSVFSCIWTEYREILCIRTFYAV